jgi:hypothetical protein
MEAAFGGTAHPELVHVGGADDDSTGGLEAGHAGRVATGMIGSAVAIKDGRGGVEGPAGPGDVGLYGHGEPAKDAIGALAVLDFIDDGIEPLIVLGEPGALAESTLISGGRSDHERAISRWRLVGPGAVR